uniref:Alternative protein LEPREL1 n=1 Tax=Homo sapiens TaxID=9606 RepID=L8E8F3_HUMAN|nr:alternative protein LEPREL1 [Homo sapiens]
MGVMITQAPGDLMDDYCMRQRGLQSFQGLGGIFGSGVFARQ